MPKFAPPLTRRVDTDSARYSAPRRPEIPKAVRDGAERVAGTIAKRVSTLNMGPRQPTPRERKVAGELVKRVRRYIPR